MPNNSDHSLYMEANPVTSSLREWPQQQMQTSPPASDMTPTVNANFTPSLREWPQQ